ncbi:MAG: hypothetical protein R6X02_20390 [Enhygromyxa sp.]
MAIIDISEIDLSQYQTTPLLSSEATLTLSQDLYNGRPNPAPPHVEKAAKRMYGTGGKVKQVLIERVELAGAESGLLASFDVAVDRFWGSLRPRLGFWMNFAHEGLELLDKDEQDKLDLEDKREKAALARELDKHIFGAEGLNFVRRPYNQQVALMASRLSFIAASPKLKAYKEVIGEELFTTLELLQGRYEKLVHERAMRDDNTSNLRLLRHTLQRHIALYANAVLSMLDEDEPQSIEIVLDALRPMVNARVRRARSPNEPDELDQPDTPAVPEPELDELAPPEPPLLDEDA